MFGFGLCIKRLGLKICYRNSHDLYDLLIEDIIPHLNKDTTFLVGIAASKLKDDTFFYEIPGEKVFKIHKDNYLSPSVHDYESVMIWFNDDQVQPYQVRLDNLPAGWK